MFNFIKKEKDGTIMEFYISYLETKTVLAELAIEIAVSRIADVVAKCGFLVISNDAAADQVRYKLNIKPNKNQTSVDFWKQVIRDMILKHEGCLLVDLHDDVFIADSWQADKSVTREKRYTSVVLNVNGDTMQLNRSFRYSDVVHLRYSNQRVMELIKQNNMELNQLYAIAKSGYSVKAPKYKVSIPSQLALVDSETGEVMTSNKYAEKIVSKLTEGDIKAIVSHSGIDISAIDSKTQMDANDVKLLREEVFTGTASAFGIPKSIMFGDFTKESFNEFITYACEPIMAIIDSALTGAWLSYDECVRGDKILVNKLCVKHIDVIDSANNLDKLYSNGWSHNDIMKLLGQPTIDENWADMRRFTKNYSEEVNKND